MGPIRHFPILILVSFACWCCKPAGSDSSEGSWTFVSVPDFLNKDTCYPQSGFEDALSYFLQAIKAENPDFVLIPGDLVNGRSAGSVRAPLTMPNGDERREIEALVETAARL